jgi:hypothetical protein
MIDHFGIDAEEAAQQPGVADEVVEQGALPGGFGLVVAVEGGGQFGEAGFFFAGDDVGFGVDAGLERVHAGNGFAHGQWSRCLVGRLLGQVLTIGLRRPAWAGGFGRVAAVGLDLSFGCHIEKDNKKVDRPGGVSYLLVTWRLMGGWAEWL